MPDCSCTKLQDFHAWPLRYGKSTLENEVLRIGLQILRFWTLHSFEEPLDFSKGYCIPLTHLYIGKGMGENTILFFWDGLIAPVQITGKDDARWVRWTNWTCDGRKTRHQTSDWPGGSQTGQKIEHQVLNSCRLLTNISCNHGPLLFKGVSEKVKD